MFQLYDRTRRRISIALFFLLCVAPTAMVVAWCVRQRLPGYAQSEAERLGRQLGARIELDNLFHPVPGRTVYEGLRVCNPETGRVIVACRRLEAATGPFVALSATGVEIQADQWDQLSAVVDRVLSCRAGWHSLDARLQVDQAVYRVAEDSCALDQVRCRVQIVSLGSQIELNFRVAGIAMPQPAWFRVVRNRQTDPPETGLEWNTGGAALPSIVLPPSLGLRQMLGADAQLSGAGWANRTAEGWAAEATGRLSEIDLDRLVTNRFPHTLNGRAQVEIKSAKVHRGRIQQLWAAVEAVPGIASDSLLEAGVRHLGLSDVDTLPRSAQTPYEQFSLEFFIDSRGLQLRGRCDDYGTICRSKQSRLLTGSSQEPLPLAALLQALAPGTHPQVPATPQTESLLSLLPVAADQSSGHVAVPARSVSAEPLGANAAKQ